MNTNRKFFLKLSLSLTLLFLFCIFLWFLGFRINLTSSVRPGIYRIVEASQKHLVRDSLVFFCLESNTQFSLLAAQRGYLAPGSCSSGLQPLLKRLRGLPGDILEVTDLGLAINGILVPNSTKPLADSLGRPAPPSVLKSETIPEGFFLVMSEDEPKGFDSRYFGLIPESSLTYVDEILIFDL